MKFSTKLTVAFVVIASISTFCVSKEVAPRAPGDGNYFCMGECEVERTRCSCSSNCKVNRSCCTDYVESCEGGSSWTETECTASQDMRCPEGFSNPVPVILLSIDGFRDIYLQRNLSPTISKLANCGVSVPYMTPVYPTKTFPNHYTIVTGLYPESHGIIANRMYNHNFEEEFRLGAVSSFNPDWWRGEPIWVSASNQGLKTAAYFWPGSDVNITRYPDYYYQYDGSVDNEERVYQVLDWLDLPEIERPSLIVLYTDIVDSAGHTTGPESNLVDQKLKEVDEMVEMIMNGLRDRGLDTCVNFMITSDHGMASVDCDNQVKYLEDYGINMTEVYFDGGPYGRVGKSKDKLLWDKFDATEVKKKLECKQSETHWEAFLKYEYLPKRYHYVTDPSIEDVHLVVDDEWWLGGERPYYCDLGGHGYDETYPDMRAFFTGHGMKLKRNYVRDKPFQNIELYNLFAELLGIEPAENNGTQGSVYDLLVTPPSVQNEGEGMQSSTCPYSGDVSEEDLGCTPCGGISDTEANQRLNLDEAQANQYNAQNMLYGQPRLFDEDSEFCVLTQRNYVTTYDNLLKMPRLVSFVLSPGNNWKTMLSKCSRPDVRIDLNATTPCSQYEETNDDLTWTYLYYPGLSEEEPISDTTITSNTAPAYDSFVEIWEYMSMTLNNWANLYNGITVDVGPIFDYDSNGIADSQNMRKSNGSFTVDDDSESTPIPTHFFLVMTRCKDYNGDRSIQDCAGNIDNIDVLNFIIPNYKEPQCYQEGTSQKDWIPKLLHRHVARIKDVELLTKISFFSKQVSSPTANTDSHLSAIRTKMHIPQMADDWVQDFLSGVTPTSKPFISTTSGFPRFVSNVYILLLCKIFIAVSNVVLL
uniref:venom phosphodiesterase 2-like n=1 Tax=Styela clava TaxID=7725 RepID=UPI0019396882|nr:venom phosphodiesterase 2-like [Styela clava]